MRLLAVLLLYADVLLIAVSAWTMWKWVQEGEEDEVDA